MNELLPQLRVPRPASGEFLDPRSLFDPAVRDVWLEIGFGAGEHLAALAEARRDLGIVGCEPFVNGVAALLARIDRQRLRNVRIFDDDARLLLPDLAESSIGRAVILFPDPWPKTRHAERRFVGPGTLNQLARVLVDGALLHIATDHPVMARWVLAHAASHSAFEWCARRPADWRRRPDGQAETRYEGKALAAGTPCVYLTFRRKARPTVLTTWEKPSCAAQLNAYISDIRSLERGLVEP